MGHRTISSPNVSVFFSYTQDDNDGHYDWIEKFAEIFQKTLGARLRGKATLQIHSYLEKPLVQGDLGAGLAQLIESSSAMLVFVHDSYLESPDCQLELQIFREKFGMAGLDTRLFVISMSANAMQALALAWGTSLNAAERRQVWIDFSDEKKRNRPMSTLGEEFNNKLDLLIDPLMDCLATPPQIQSRPARAAVAARRWVVGACVDELASEAERLRQLMSRRAGNEVTLLQRDALVGDLAGFADADDLVLPFNEAALLIPTVPGGHLGLQQRAWLDAGKPSSSIHWLDMRHVAPKRPAPPEQLEALRRMVTNPVGFAELVQVEDTGGEHDQAVLYIESNTIEVDHWDTLGQHLRPHWENIATGAAPPQLSFLHRGLPIDQLSRFKTLNDADGFILLWGQKDPEALVAQILAVEKRVRSSGADLPPGIVAYLVPPQKHSESKVPAYGWHVLRFDATHRDTIDVVRDESDRLEKFLKQVHSRVMRRRAAQPEAVEAVLQ